MSYKTLLKKIAKEHNTTPEEVDKEMREAIKYTGMDVEPEVFISMMASKVRSKMKQQ